MKLRLDRLAQVTSQDILEGASQKTHRYGPEPLFSKTGTGKLSSASIEDCASELEHSTDLIQKLDQRANNSGPIPSTKK